MIFLKYMFLLIMIIVMTLTAILVIFEDDLFSKVVIFVSLNCVAMSMFVGYSSCKERE